MKSAYGRQTQVSDYELTCVEQGSPMGELLRRYWQPVCTSDELRDLPKGLSGNKRAIWGISIRRDSVVPLAVEFGAFDIDCGHLRIRNDNAAVSS